MAIRLTGLTSGLDTDSIVQELVSAYSTKTQKYEKAATKLTWKQDIWKNLNTKVYNLYTSVSNLRFSSAYNLKKVTVSDNTKATVTASASAVTGTQTLSVKQTAQTCYMTGGYLGDGVTSDTTLEELGFTESSTTENSAKQYAFKVKFTDGTTEEITFTKDTTVSEMVNKLKTAGLNANFDENNGRIFLSSKKSGTENDFTLYASTTDGLNALSALKLDVALVDENKNFISPAADEYKNAYENYYDAWKNDNVHGSLASQSIYEYVDYVYNNVYLGAYESKETAEATITSNQNSIDAFNREIEALKKKQTAMESFVEVRNAVLGQESISSDATVTDNLTDEVIDKMLSATTSEEIKTIYFDETGETLSNTQAEAIKEVLDSKADDVNIYQTYTSSIISGSLAIDITDLKSQIQDASDSIDDYTNGWDSNGTHYKGIKECQQEIDDLQAADGDIAKANAILEQYSDLAEVKEIADEINKKIKEVNESDKSDADKLEEIAGLEAQRDAQVENALMQLAALAEKANEIKEDKDGKYSNGNAVQTYGSDAVIVLNGVEYTSSDNNFTINGLSITALSKTTEDITINTSVDTQGIYDTIKDFLTEYNNIINEMTKLYNADSASDYEPLTDEEKESMSDEQIEKWETKIKDSLLRRDTTLNSIMSAMINAMAQTFEINGKTYSLSTFGIQTLGYLNAAENENYAYHIDGDEDDDNTSGNEDKLMAAIMEDPEAVEEFMKKLCSSLYTAIDDKMKSTELSSVYKVYNDKEMDSEMTRYEEAISKWEQKVQDKEDYYYNKFSAMETALSKLESQSSSLSGLLGS